MHNFGFKLFLKQGTMKTKDTCFGTNFGPIPNAVSLVIFNICTYNSFLT